jgi:hypothetical protein
MLALSRRQKMETTEIVTQSDNTEVIAAAAEETAPVLTYQRTDVAFTPRRGFETVLYAALEQPHTTESVVNELLTSGEYRRVAPQAASLRPFRPVNTLIRQWLELGVIAAVEPVAVEDEPASDNMAADADVA